MPVLALGTGAASVLVQGHSCDGDSGEDHLQRC